MRSCGIILLMRRLSSFHGGHTSFGDGEGKVADIARAAARRDFRAFGFSEHFDRPPCDPVLPAGEDDVLGDRGIWIDSYVRSVEEVRAELASELPIRLGVEIDFIRGARDWTSQSLSEWPFEYLVGSVHYMRFDHQDLCIDCNRDLVGETLKRSGDTEQLQLDYYDHVLGLLEWDLIRIVGHMDLIKLFLTTDERRPTAAIRSKVGEVLDSILAHGVAIDVNSAGIRKACREIYPAPWILRDAARLNVPITLGDDSHSADQVGDGLHAAIDAVLAAGYRALWVIDEDGHLLEEPLPVD